MDDIERHLSDLYEEDNSKLNLLLRTAYKRGREAGIEDMEEGFSNMVAMILSYTQQGDDAPIN